MNPCSYAIDTGWRALFKDLGADPASVVRRSGLPGDLFARSSGRLSTEEYFALWDALEAEVNDPLFPITLCSTIRSDSFSPPIFAALCSPDLLTALRRISHYKPLVAPMRLDVREEGDLVTLDIEWLDKGLEPPLSMVAAELLFFVALARMGTREDVRPARVVTKVLPTPAIAYEQFLGARVLRGDGHRVCFTRADALRPFLTSNAGMWTAFEPELKRRLAELDETASTEERVRAALLEGLPSGLTTMEAVAKKLGMSKRTLQRRLEGEARTYQKILQDTRESLARHYLEKTRLATAEISFLLGFGEPSSFYRAFSDWTGQTPDRVRQGLSA